MVLALRRQLALLAHVRLRVLVALFAALVLLDAATTLAVLAHGGREANWAQAWLFAHLSVAAGLALKLLVSAFIAANIAWSGGSRAPAHTRWLERVELLVFDALMAAVVLNNAVVLLVQVAASAHRG